MSIAISPIQPGQAETVRNLLIKISTESFDFPGEALQSYWQAWTVETIGRCAQNARQVLLAVWDGTEPVGLLLGTPPEGGVATIIWMLVAGKYRSQGIGGRMFKEACTRYKAIDCHKVKLTVPTEAAKKFYEKQGMVVEGFHPNHWWGKDFWSMGKQL